MTSSGGRGRVTGLAPGEVTAAGGPTAESGSAADPSYLLWAVGLAATVLAVIAFVLWTRHGAGILLDMMFAFCA